MRISTDHRAPVLLVGAMLLTVAAYCVGLNGPYLLDDISNLKDIPLWLNGELGLWTLLFERGAGTLGRPLSMASFAINAWLGGANPLSFKIGNLIIHLACGTILFFLTRRILGRDAQLRERAPFVAAAVASLWLLHPLNVSTVLYVVQRMAQLSTLVILFGLWLYIHARERLEQAPCHAATSAILLGIPIVTCIAFLAKENGILLPLLCGVLELAYFSASSKHPRPLAARIFLVAYLFVPSMIGLVGFLLKPDWILGGYLGRDFTLGERLLSQGRALCDYIGKILVPNPPQMGVFTDDFIASTGLFSPPNTVLALLTLCAVTIVVWRFRTSLPSVYFGWAFYLIAHSLESGVIALELYFEHRNYLPSMGLILATVAAFIASGDALKRIGTRSHHLGLMFFSGILVLLATGTHGRARIWRSDLMIAESSLQSHPDSLRANAYLLGISLDHGDMRLANEILQRLITSSSPRNRSLGYAYRLFVGCIYRKHGDPADLEAFVTLTPLPLTLAEVQPFDTLYQATRETKCRDITDRMIGDALARLADRAENQLNTSREKSRLRYQAASFYARSQDWKNAIAQGRLAWQPGVEASFAIPLIQGHLAVGEIDAAEYIFLKAQKRSDKSNQEEQDILRWLENQIIHARKISGR